MWGVSFLVVQPNEKFYVNSKILPNCGSFIFQFRDRALELYHRDDDTQGNKPLPTNVDIWNRNHKNTNKISVRVFYAKQAEQKEPLRVLTDFSSFTSWYFTYYLKCYYKLYGFWTHRRKRTLQYFLSSISDSNQPKSNFFKSGFVKLLWLAM